MTAPRHIDDAQDYLEKIIASLRSLSSDDKGPMLGTLEYLAAHLQQTRRELACLAPPGNPPLAPTTDDLAAVLAETAQATDAIMDAAETVEQLAQAVPQDIADKLRDAATRIYEASAFQDITGQRISKVVQALQAMDARIATLAAACNSVDPAPVAASRAGDAELLNGPQLPGQANNQSDIDRLFEEL